MHRDGRQGRAEVSKIRFWWIIWVINVFYFENRNVICCHRYINIFPLEGCIFPSLKMARFLNFSLNITCICSMLASCVVQPLDLLKNRMQLSGVGSAKKEYKTSFHAIRSIVANEGFFALYNGLSAGLLRQATYTTTRLGIYTWLFEMSTG